MKVLHDAGTTMFLTLNCMASLLWTTAAQSAAATDVMNPAAVQTTSMLRSEEKEREICIVTKKTYDQQQLASLEPAVLENYRQECCLFDGGLGTTTHGNHFNFDKPRWIGQSSNFKG